MRWIWNSFFANKAPAWSAAATIVMMIFSGLLWQANRRSNDADVMSQRAFINFVGPGMSPDIRNKTFVGTNVTWSISNSGTTPANNLTFEWNLSLGSISPDKNTDFDSLPQTERNRIVLGPKAVYQFKPVYISQQDWEDVTAGRKHIFFWGWVTYYDIFKKTPERLSEFCTDVTSAVWATADHTGPTALVNLVTPPCPTHNCYDENCTDYSTRTR